MNVKSRTLVALLALGGFVAIAVAEPAKETKPAKPAASTKAAAEADVAKPEAKLPPGWTEADLKAFMEAATPGDMHKRLVADAGTWQGKNTMWMAPDAKPIETEATTIITPILDGRFTRLEMKGEMPGMGPYHGLAVQGFDNIEQKFIST